jgi:hypothetical protein
MMVEQLFGSKTRVKLLQLFFSNPNRAFYVREITRKIDEQINSVRRELSNLLSVGIITRDEVSGIDVLIVGDVNQAKAAKFITELEQAENKELRYTVIPLDNYQYRVQINDRFIGNVLASKKQVIINNQNLVTEQ